MVSHKMESSSSDSHNDSGPIIESFEKTFIEEFGTPAFKDYAWTDDSNPHEDAAFEYVDMENFPQPDGYSNNVDTQSPATGTPSFNGNSPTRQSILDNKHQFNRRTSPRAHFARTSTMPVTTAVYRPQPYPTAASTPTPDLDIALDYNNFDMLSGQPYDSTAHIQHPSQSLRGNTSRTSTYDSYFNTEFDAIGRPIYYPSESSHADVHDFKMSGSDTSGPEFSAPYRSTRSGGQGMDSESTIMRISRSSIPSVESEHIEKRRVQNRNSQRAFRERKASYINELENKLSTLQTKYDLLLECSRNLRSAYANVEKLLETKGVVHTAEKNCSSSNNGGNSGKKKSGNRN